MILKIKKYISLSATILTLMAVSNNVSANLDINTRVSGQEKAVFAFFRAAGGYPNYDSWIKSSNKYRSINNSEKERFLLNETMRLGQGFGNFDVHNHALEIKTDVLMTYTPSNTDEPPRISFTFPSDIENYIPAFIYPYGNEDVSLIINKLAKFSNLELNPKQNKMILSKIPYTDKEVHAKLHMHIIVTQADNKRPVNNKGKKLWVMMGEVGYIKMEIAPVYEIENPKLWDYVAPWYEEQFEIINTPEEEKYPHPYDLFQ